MSDSKRVDPEHNAKPASRTFRFKTKAVERDHVYVDLPQYSDSKGRRSHRRYHEGGSRRKRRRLTEEDKHVSQASKLDPDTAFRESLFDALADEQGADYWQSVYGQPIHSYSRSYANPETGELEEMNDDQYAAYVRKKMWEKSAEGIEAARQAQRQRIKDHEHARRQRGIRTKNLESDNAEYVWNEQAPEFENAVNASLQRGRARRERKHWTEIWRKYTVKWKELNDMYECQKNPSADNSEQISFHNKIAWPVESLSSQDVSIDKIQTFVHKVYAALDEEESTRTLTKLSLLKTERIRWHPDKIQQKFGFLSIEPGTMEGVTAVFQILDSMYNELRSQQ